MKIFVISYVRFLKVGESIVAQSVTAGSDDDE